MHIAINLLFVRPNQIGGVETFVVNLVKNLLEIDKKNKYFFIVTKNNKKLFDFKRSQCLELHFNNSSRIKRIFFEQFFLPQELKKKKIDLLIMPGNTGLVKCPYKSLLIVHDLISFVYPKYYSLLRRIYLQNLIRYSCKKADKIIAVSQSTKNDIIKYINIDKDKINVVYEGVDFEKFFKAEKDKNENFIQKQYGIKRYVFSPTSLYPHKNNNLLVEVFTKLKKEKKIPQKLIITGIDPYNKSDWINNIINKKGMKDEIFYIGRVPDKYMPALYREAEAMIYLSAYEGFGLPIIEAMAAGCPVLSSNKSSLPEVVGEAGIIIDPSNVQEIVNKTYTLLTDKNLRERYINKGLIRAKNFSWEKVAQELIKSYV